MYRWWSQLFTISLQFFCCENLNVCNTVSIEWEVNKSLSKAKKLLFIISICWKESKTERTFVCSHHLHRADSIKLLCEKWSRFFIIRFNSICPMICNGQLRWIIYYLVWNWHLNVRFMLHGLYKLCLCVCVHWQYPHSFHFTSTS